MASCTGGSSQSSQLSPGSGGSPSSHASSGNGAAAGSGGGGSVSVPNAKRRYILFKSLDHHDLTISQTQGIWATLPKNKTLVNQLFDASDELYAFFSVNKSGAFQGYAKVLCGIGRECQDIEWLKEDGSGQIKRACLLCFAFFPCCTKTASQRSLVSRLTPSIRCTLLHCTALF